MIYSYCRVSTDQQDFARQESAIIDYCTKNDIKIDKEFSDKISGKTFNRQSYQEMKGLIVSGDCIIIKELDRLGRTMDLIKEEWNYFMTNDVRIIVVDMPLISSDITKTRTLDQRFMSNMVFELLCYMAEKEREKISQRTREALAVKKASGVILGRKNTYTEEQRAEMKIMYELGFPIEQITDKIGISYQRFMAIAKEKNFNRQLRKINIGANRG